MTSLRLTAVIVFAVLGAATATAAPTSPAPYGVSTLMSGMSASMVPVAQIISNPFELSVGLGDLEDHVQERGKPMGLRFKQWGNFVYTTFFLLQFLLIGATMLVRGPFALASTRPGSAFGPFANFFFFLVAGALGYLFVAYSYYPIDGTDVPGGWVAWFFDFFRETGEEAGCRGGKVLLIANPCKPDELASIGAKLSNIILAFTPKTGGAATFSSRAYTAASASTGVFGAFSVLAIQLAITRIAFQLAIVTAPLFLATLIFKPISGIANGFVSFVLYLGVRLFVLYLIAGIATYIAGKWFENMAGELLRAFAISQSPVGAQDILTRVSSAFSNNIEVLTMSLLLLGLTLYLPSKIAEKISSGFRLDLNALLFQGELPIQID